MCLEHIALGTVHFFRNLLPAPKAHISEVQYQLVLHAWHLPDLSLNFSFKVYKTVHICVDVSDLKA